MKTIHYKKFKVPHPARCYTCGQAMIPGGDGIPQEREVSYKELMISAIDNAPQGGFTPKIMAERNKVAEKILESKGFVKLEDAEFDVLHQAVQALPFKVRAMGFTEYWSYLDQVKETKEEPEKAKK